MLKKLGIGLAFASAAAAIAIGCSSSSSSHVGGTPPGGPELPGSTFPASAIAQNNLAADGGGFSMNAQNFVVVACQFNSADGSAMIVFETTEIGGTVGTVDPGAGAPPLLPGAGGKINRYWASYYAGNGQTLTPPVELTGIDRIEADALPSGSPWTNINATVMVPLNTQGYVDSAGAQNSQVSQNQGNWLILWDAQTYNQSPTLIFPDGTTASGPGTPVASAQGSHHTFYATVFIKNLASQPSAQNAQIGNTSTTGTSNATPQEFRYGFQVFGTEVPTNRGGASATATDMFALGIGSAGILTGATTMVNAAPDQAGFDFRPAEDVVSFGVASDTLKGQANFGTSVGGNLISGLTGLVPGNVLGTTHGGAFIPGVTQWTNGGSGTTVPALKKRPGGAAPGNAKYKVGDNTSFIQLFWVQLISSTAGQTLTLASGTSASSKKDGSIQLGPQYKMLTANFNLATMQVPASGVGSPAVLPFPAATLRGTLGANGAAIGATQPLANFVTYNNLIFWEYIDASMATGNAVGIAGTGLDEAVVEQVSQVQAINAVALSTAGTAVISANAQEVTRAGTNFKHATAVGDPRDARTLGGAATGNRNIYAGNAISIGFNTISGGNFNGTANHVTGDEFVEQPDNGCIIVGPDEGACDVTALFLSRVTTNGGSATVDEDYELTAFAVNKDGTVITGETGPQVLSSHKPEPDPDHSVNAYDPAHLVLANPGPDTILRDDVFDVKAVQNRDGEYVIVGYRQAQGTSVAQHTSLLANCLKVFRCVACNSGGGASGTTNPTLANRFLAAPLGTGTVPVAGNGTVINSTINLTAGNYAQSPVITNSVTTGIGNQSLAAVGPAVQAYQFQNDMSYKCGFQSDRTKVCVLWAHGDGSDDRVFVKTITVGGIASTNLTTDNPTLTFSGEQELESVASVAGPATIVLNPTGVSAGSNVNLRSTYHFLPGSVATPSGNGTGDAGPGFATPATVTIVGYRLEGSETLRGTTGFVVAPFPGFPLHTSAGTWPKDNGGISGSGLGFPYTFNENSGNGITGFDVTDAGPDSTGTGGAVVIFFQKITDATTTDGNGWSQAVFADLYNNTAITDRVVMSRRLRLSGGVDQGENVLPSGFGIGSTPPFDTKLSSAVPVPTSNDICSITFSAQSIYVYLTAPSGDNGSSPTGCFTRKLDLQGRRNPNGGTAPTFASLFTPPTDNATTPTTNNFQDPQRLDRELYSNAAFVDTFHAGTSVIVVISQDNHLWGSSTTDGKSYSNTNGKPTPQLIDDNLSTRITSITANYNTCRVKTGCDDLHGSLLGFTKLDTDANLRFYLRVLQ